MQRRFGDKTEATQSVSPGGEHGTKPGGCPQEVRGSQCDPQAFSVVPVYMWGINVSTHCLTEEIQL